MSVCPCVCQEHSIISWSLMFSNNPLSPLLWSRDVNFSGCSSLALWKSRHKSASRPVIGHLVTKYWTLIGCYRAQSSCSWRIFVRRPHLFAQTRWSPGYPLILACHHVNTLSHYNLTSPYRKLIIFGQFRTSTRYILYINFDGYSNSFVHWLSI